MKKLLLATSAALLLALSSGIAGASAADLKASTTASKVLKYTITLKVGQTYQLGSGRNYTYYKSGYAKDSFGVSSTGLVTAYNWNFQVQDWEDHGIINVVDANGNELEEVHVRITP